MTKIAYCSITERQCTEQLTICNVDWKSLLNYMRTEFKTFTMIELFIALEDKGRRSEETTQT